MTKLIVLAIIAGYLLGAKNSFEKYVLRAETNHKNRHPSLDVKDYRGEFVGDGIITAIVWPFYRFWVAFVSESANGYVARVFSKGKTK